MRKKTENSKRHHLDRRAGFIISALKADGEPDDLMTTDEVAYFFGVHPSWFEIGRLKGEGPPSIKLSTRRLRYRRDQVIEWLAGRMGSPSAIKAHARVAIARAEASL